MFKVWVLMLSFGGISVISIDDIATEAECQRLGRMHVENRWTATENKFRCIEVEKISHPAPPAG